MSYFFLTTVLHFFSCSLGALIKLSYMNTMIYITITFLVYNLYPTFSPEILLFPKKNSYFSIEMFYFFLKMSYFFHKMSYFFHNKSPTFFSQLSYIFFTTVLLFFSCSLGALYKYISMLVKKELSK